MTWRELISVKTFLAKKGLQRKDKEQQQYKNDQKEMKYDSYQYDVILLQALIIFISFVYEVIYIVSVFTAHIFDTVPKYKQKSRAGQQRENYSISAHVFLLEYVVFIPDAEKWTTWLSILHVHLISKLNR